MSKGKYDDISWRVRVAATEFCGGVLWVVWSVTVVDVVGCEPREKKVELVIGEEASRTCGWRRR